MSDCTDDGIVHNRCQQPRCTLAAQLWQMRAGICIQIFYILADGTFLCTGKSQTPVTDPGILIAGISDGRLARVSLQIVRSDKHKQNYCGDSSLVMK